MPQASQKQVQQQCDLFRTEAETAQHQVQNYVQQKQKREAELYVKVGRGTLSVHPTSALAYVHTVPVRLVTDIAVCSCSQ